MSNLQRAVNNMIGGIKGEWFFDFEIGDVRFQGGYFYRIGDARKFMLNKLRVVIKDDSIITLCLERAFND